MTTANLEHVNLTVSNPDLSAAALCRIFDWHIRWQGDSMNNGRTVHVGNQSSYVALYMPSRLSDGEDEHGLTVGGLNHVAVVVDDLDQIEQRVKAQGYATFNHADYDPGRRFYFYDGDGIEFEVVQY